MDKLAALLLAGCSLAAPRGYGVAVLNDPALLACAAECNEVRVACGDACGYVCEGSARCRVGCAQDCETIWRGCRARCDRAAKER